MSIVSLYSSYILSPSEIMYLMYTLSCIVFSIDHNCNKVFYFSYYYLHLSISGSYRISYVNLELQVS